MVEGHIQPGDVIGTQTCFEGKRMGLTVRAVTPCEVLVIKVGQAGMQGPAGWLAWGMRTMTMTSREQQQQREPTTQPQSSRPTDHSAAARHIPICATAVNGAVEDTQRHDMRSCAVLWCVCVCPPA